MIEYDVLIKKLEEALKENVVCEDNEVHLKCKLKYDVYNIMVENNPLFIKQLHKDLEYNGDK